MFDIPFHWIEAAKLAKKISKDFFLKVSIDDFRSWNRYKKYEYTNKGRYPFTVNIKHTKIWECYCDWDNDFIKLNLSEDIFDENQFEVSEEPWKDRITMILTHEITHYMQYFYEIDRDMSEEELHYCYIPGNGARTSYDKMFLYITNWMEMDADLSAIFYIMKYKNIDCNLLHRYYHQTLIGNHYIAGEAAKYVYNYFWKDIKDFDLRKRIENKEFSFDKQIKIK